jgi:hypothetical protein
MKIQVGQKEINELKNYLNAILLLESTLIVIKDYKIEEVTIKRWLHKPKLVKYLTNITINCYNSKFHWIGVFDQDVSFRILTYNNLNQLRQNWLDFKEGLKAFGFTIIKTPKPDSQLKLDF